MRRMLSTAVLLLPVFGAARAEDPTDRFIVFFSSWSALIGQPGHDAVVAAAVAAKKNPNAPVNVTGYASTVGSVEANRLLSQLRAHVIADELVADGVDIKRITMTAPGPTSFALDPLEARRAVIDVGKN